MFRIAVLACSLAVSLACVGVAQAGSQSSNSSSNCSNGHCTRMDTYVVEDDWGGRRVYRRFDSWREPARGWRPQSGEWRYWRQSPHWQERRHYRRHHDDDDD